MTRRTKEEEEDNGFQDVELSTLQRQFRVAEGYRKAYTDESQNILRKQEEQINKLQKDHEELQEEIRLAEEAERSHMQIEQTCATMSSKLRLHEEEVEEEMGRNEDLSQQLRDIERKLERKRRSVGGVSGVQEKKSKMKAQVSTMENRLEKMLKTFNEKLTENSTLREKIDHLKQERKVFDTMHQRLEKEIKEIKRRMAAIVEQSHRAHEARDEAQSKIATLEEKAGKELQMYNLEIKELSRVLEHDRKLKTFMGVKSLPRNLEEVPVSHKRKARAADTPEQMVHTYEEAFRKIKNMTGFEDTTKLVDRFIEVEDQNFSLFNLVNELNNEIEQLQEQIQEIKTNIRKFNQEGEAMDKQRKIALHELEERLRSAQLHAKSYESKYSETTEQLQVLIRGINSIYNSPVCDKSLVIQALGNGTINESNVMQYLGSIEQRANELLQLQAMLDQKEKETWETKEAELREEHDEEEAFDAIRTLGPKPMPGSLLGTGPAQPLRAEAFLPTEELDQHTTVDDEDDATRPLSHAELKQKIMASMAKKTRA